MTKVPQQRSYIADPIWIGFVGERMSFKIEATILADELLVESEQALNVIVRTDRLEGAVTAEEIVALLDGPPTV